MKTLRSGFCALLVLGLVLDACSSDTSSGPSQDAGPDGQTPASSGGTSSSGGKGGASGSTVGSGGATTAPGSGASSGKGGSGASSTGGAAATHGDGGPDASSGGNSGTGGNNAGGSTSVAPDAGDNSDAGGDAGSTPAVTGVGDPIAGVPAPSASIGASGGTVVSGDGQVTLTIPAGALTTATSIGIATIANTAPAGTGFAYRFTPDGLTFAKPVTLALKPTFGQLDGSSIDHVQLAFQDAQGRWQLVPVTFDKGANTVTATTTHFTDYAYLLDLALSSETDVLFANSSTELHVVKLHTAGGYAGIVGPASTGNPTWALDGVPPSGKTADGELDILANAAAYTAPTQIPATNPVAVSVSFTADDGTKVSLVQNLYILAHKYGFKVTLTNNATCTGGSGYAYDYSTTGTIDLSLDGSFNISSSNASAAVTPNISAITVCNVPSCTAMAEPDKTTGLSLTTVTGAWDHSIHRLRIQPRGTNSSSPSMVVNCGQAGSHEIVASPGVWNGPGYAGFMQGKDGEMASSLVNLASGVAGPSFTLTVETP
ncbi:MAG TPA: hypothetical protein VHC69_18115 [Polyangiaceae bacterium]|nr:hypothetical protein [Polyangiaceae bacterium]